MNGKGDIRLLDYGRKEEKEEQKEEGKEGKEKKEGEGYMSSALV